MVKSSRTVGSSGVVFVCAAGMPGDQGVASGADVVHSKHVGALFRGGNGDAQRSGGAFFDGATEDFGQETFS